MTDSGAAEKGENDRKDRGDTIDEMDETDEMGEMNGAGAADEQGPATPGEDQDALDELIERGRAVPRVDLDKLIDQFVALYTDRPRQRSEAWLAGRAGTIGSSELAALMGMNPYQGLAATVASKAGLKGWTGGGVACWWGTFFEPAAEALLAVEVGSTPKGTDISVPAAFAGHAGSPDGYCVVGAYRDPEHGGAWSLVTTDAAAQARAEEAAVVRQIVLLEFKCPYRRMPKGDIPKHYRPQLWSGLALAPIAHRALFVDTAFRKCALADLGPSAAYDWDYHRERRPERWGGAYAWGLAAVYAPAPAARRKRAAPEGAAGAAGAPGAGDHAAPPRDPAREAWGLYAALLGQQPELVPAGDGVRLVAGPADFGDCDNAAFEKMLGYAANEGLLRHEHVGPCFPDGRGPDLRTGEAIGAAIDALGEAPPEGHYLLGVFPWKIFEVSYVFAERRPGFFDEVRPLIDRALGLATAIRGAPDPNEAYRAQFEPALKKSAAPPPGAASAEEFFDWLDD